MRRDYSREERLERACLRAAINIRGLWEETGYSDTRLLEAVVLPDELTIVGRSRRLSGPPRREHVVPRIMIIEECKKLLPEASDFDLAKLILENTKIVLITEEERLHLDGRAGLNLRERMPKGWVFGDDIYARLKAAGIEWEAYEHRAPIQIPPLPDEVKGAGADYKTDFHRWAQLQGERIRARDVRAIDWDNVSEEIESLGREEVRSAEGLLTRIVEYLHKFRSAKVDGPRHNWRAEVLAFRCQIRSRLTPSIRERLEADLDRLHEDGAREAGRWLYNDDIEFLPIDVDRRWSLAQLLGEEHDPLPTLWNVKP